MQSKLLALIALAGTAIASSLPFADSEYPEGTTITIYPRGVPEHLKPDAAEASGAEKREANAGVYLCDDAFFNGYCVHIHQPLNQCVNLSGDLNDKVSSVGPDSPNYCMFYKAFNCNDSEGHFGTFSPGEKNLGTFSGGQFNDAISSYVCWPQ